MDLSKVSTDDLINELCNKRGYVHVFWQLEDIIDRARSDYELELTEEEAQQIAENISNNWDASIGVSWDTIDIFINDWKNEQRKNSVE